MHVLKKDHPCVKEEFTLSSKIPFKQNGCSFMPAFRNSFAAFYGQEDTQWIRMGVEKKTNGVRYLNPKPTTIKQTN